MDLAPRILVAVVLLVVIGVCGRGIWWLLHPATALEIRPFEVVRGGEVQKGQLEMTARVLTSKLRDITGVLHPEQARNNSGQRGLGLQMEGPYLPDVVLGEREFNLKAFNVDVGGIFGTIYKVLYNGPVLQGAVILSDKGVEVLAEYLGDSHAGLGRFNSTSGLSLDEAIEKLAYKIAFDFCRNNDPQFAQLTEEDFRIYVKAMREYRYYEDARGRSEAEMERHARNMAATLEQSAAKDKTSSIIYSALDTVYRYLNVPEQTQSLLEKALEANPNDAAAKRQLASVRTLIEHNRNVAGEDNQVTLVNMRNQAALKAIRVAEAVEKVPKPSEVIVAVLADGNSAVDEELKKHFLSAPSEGSESFSLTANMASLIVAICPSARILPLKALTDSDFVHGVQESAKAGARIVLIAVGGPAQSRIRLQAIEEARRSNMLFIGAAGNERSERKVFPAADDGVMAVAACDNHGHRARFSNYGSWVNLCAPGVDVLTLDRDGAVRQISGSSFAAAVATGVGALVLAANPQLTGDGLEKLLRETAVPMPAAEKMGSGRVDALAAVLKALK